MGPCQMACMTPGALSSRPPCRTQPGDPRGCRPLTGPRALAWSGRGHLLQFARCPASQVQGPLHRGANAGVPLEWQGLDSGLLNLLGEPPFSDKAREP